MSKQYTWYKLDETSLPVTESDIKILEVNGKKLCCTLFGGQLFAFAYKCPHASGIMADGFIDNAGNVVCPLHRYRFSIKNGRNVSGEGYYLKTYPVEQREDGYFLGMEKSGWLW
ncbi:3-phenylpropionate/trans-cinnamate dioxygenase ferredoxin subunit [Chitinophaga dinghuensis]|uniref:3-phenylpropionate/trans-cinnamate dioxygenase ferredoxin subunit n=1 Tax=Chitinophaga dinghuensis TaxID=1539050 RepID=A0A327W6S1_9BACT|nr:Rieske 2Fe-2S domain-containing protein [Chitinophaga dinghuensis]RAJ85314.1 3-phenylpropionate/trans-cinnamate dioxygenase ferredoxin subunit [Chitinophaga dinghuensis]